MFDELPVGSEALGAADDEAVVGARPMCDGASSASRTKGSPSRDRSSGHPSANCRRDSAADPRVS